MSWIRHHGIIVTDDDAEQLKAVHAFAVSIFPVVSPILSADFNGYASFFIPPDGSKEGWGGSNEGDARRERFIAWLREAPRSCEWLEYEHDVDNDRALITQSYSGWSGLMPRNLREVPPA